MPDRYICDCGYSSEAFAENCPMCGAMMMTIDGEEDEFEPGKAEKYDGEEDETEEVQAITQQKAA